MADDQVTIDPEFRPPMPNGDQGGRLKTIGVVGVVVAAFAFGWLMRSPEPSETEADEAPAAASVTSTTGPGETESSTTTRPSTTTTSAPPEAIGLGVPLDEAVPGLTDVVTIAQWTETRVDLARWRASQYASETIASFDTVDGPQFAGIDASGTWYALESDFGVLSVHRLEASHADSGWFPDLRAVGVRIVNLAWHDTEPGQLAWLACSRTPGGPGTLFRLDVADITAEPVAVVSVEKACSQESSVWLQQWGEWGFVLARWNDEQPGPILLGADGSEIAPIGGWPTDTWLVAGHSEGTLWTQDSGGTGGSSFLLSPDGQSRTPVPGLTQGEQVMHARWSPDGSRLALLAHRPEGRTTAIRIVEPRTAATIAEIAVSAAPEWGIAVGPWSTDGRFLLVDRLVCPDGCEFEAPQGRELLFYDTQNATTSAINLPDGDVWGGVWLTDPATPAALAAHYPLEGDATDLSGYNNDGAVVGATPTSDRFGTPDAAYAFDGEDDRIVVTMGSQLQADAVSIAAWVRMDDNATPRPIGEWWSVVSYGNLGHVLAIQGEGAVLGGLQNTGIDCEFTEGDTVLDGSWHHVAMTRDANWVIRVYLDGVVRATTPDTLDPAESDATTDVACTAAPVFRNSVLIGGDLVSSAYFHGSIDDVRIYSGVLTDEEIAALAADTT